MDTWVFNIKIDYTRNTKINEKKKKQLTDGVETE